MNSLATAIKNKVSGVKNAVIDKTSDVLSYPKRQYHGNKQRAADKEYNTLRGARDMQKLPRFDAPGVPSTAAKYSAAAEAIKNKYKK